MAIMGQRGLKTKGDVCAAQAQQFTEFTAALWRNESGAPSNTLNNVSASGAEELKTARDWQNGSTLRDRDYDQAQHLSLASSATDVADVRIGSNLFGLAFIHVDALSMIQRSIAQAESTTRADRAAAVYLVDTAWRGVCFRLHSAREGADQKLRFRLLRFCLEFAFATSSRAITFAEPQTPSSQTASREHAGARQGFGVRWQLQLLQPLLGGFKAQDELLSLFVYRKDNLPSSLQSRMSAIKVRFPSAARILEKWDSGDLDQERINFSTRENVLPCTLTYLLLEYSTLLDSGGNVQEKMADFYIMRDIVADMLKCQSCAEDMPSRLKELMQFTEGTIEAASGMLDEAAQSNNHVTGEEFLCCCLENSPKIETPSDPALQEEVDMSSAASISSPSTVQPSTPLSHATNFPASADTSLSSPCLLKSMQPVRGAPEVPVNTANEDPVSRRRSTGQLPPITPKKEKLAVRIDVTGTPSGARPPPSPAVQARSRGNSDSSNQCIFQDLLDSTESISLLYRHFSLAFRPFFSFYKIETIGDLSAMTVDKVKTFGIKDPVVTVIKALEEFSGRRTRLKNIASSPFRQRVQSPAVPPMSPAPIGTSPSPRRILKRGANSASNFANPLALESPLRKRARRSLLELSSELDAVDEEEESKRTRELPKLAERVTFCLPSDERATRITRPGEDSQDPHSDAHATVVNEGDSEEERMETYSLKFLQHLRRSAYYVGKLEEAAGESLQSKVSLRTNAAKVAERHGVVREAQDLVLKMTEQLAAMTQARAAKFQNLAQAEQGDTE